MVLVAAIAVLLVGLVVLVVVGVRLLQPVGGPARATAADGFEWVRSIYGFGPSRDAQLLEPTSVAFAPNGDVYANDPQRSRVMRFGPDGAFKALVHTGAGGTGTGQFLRPAGLATDVDGNLYIADPVANKVIVFGDGGSYLREWPTARPLGLTVRDDAVYVITNGRVTVFSKSGEDRGSFGRRGRAREDIDAYQGIATDGKRIYIADALNQSVKAFDKAGDVVWASTDASASGSAVSTATVGEQAGFGLPQDLAFDGAGRLVVIDAFDFQMIVIDPKNGKVLGRFGDYGSRDGLFFYPTGIDYDAQRDWFAVADTRNNRVQIVRIPGSGESTVASARRLVSGPYRYCALPLFLMVLALVVAVVTRRRKGDRQAGAGQ
jgi:DNA-binding beta-propeller fold protein YncE